MRTKAGSLKATPLIVAVKRSRIDEFARESSLLQPSNHRTGVRSSLNSPSATELRAGSAGLPRVSKRRQKNINRAKNMFVKTSIVAAAFAAVVGTGFAGVIVDEPFNYAPGSNLGGQGGWVNVNTGDEITVVAGSLSGA